MLLDERPLSHASIFLAAITSVAFGSAWFRYFRGPEVSDSPDGPSLVMALLFGIAQLVVAYVVASRLQRHDVRGARVGLEVGAGVGLPCACASAGYALLGGPTPLTHVLVVAAYALLSAMIMGGVIGGVARQHVSSNVWSRRTLTASSRLGRL